MLEFIRTKKALRIAWEEVIADAVRYHYNRYKPEKVEIWVNKIYANKIISSYKDKEIVHNSLEDFINLIFKDQMKWNRNRSHYYVSKYFCNPTISFFARINSKKVYYYERSYFSMEDVRSRAYPKNLYPVRQTKIISYLTHSDERLRKIAREIVDGARADFERDYSLDYFTGPKELIKYAQKFTTLPITHKKHAAWGTKQYLEIGSPHPPSNMTHYFNYRLTPKSYFKERFEEEIKNLTPSVFYDHQYTKEVWLKNLEEKIWKQLSFKEKLYSWWKRVSRIKLA